MTKLSDWTNAAQKSPRPMRLARQLTRRNEQVPVQSMAPQAAYRRAQTDGAGPRPADLVTLQRAVGNRLVQRSFQHKGKKRKAETYGPKSDSLPTIHGVPAGDLKNLADDEYDFGPIEDRLGFDAAWAVYQQRHQRQAEVVPLDQEQQGNVTVLDEEEVEQNLFAGTVRMTFQLDWLQGKHDNPFMIRHSTEEPRKMQGTQMRLSKDQYSTLASGAPKTLAMAQLAALFAGPERTRLDFSVMGARQDDNLYYEISAMWATTGLTERHVLVLYHCFPDKKDEKKFGM